MRFMNTWEIDERARHYYRHPVLGPATRTLASLRTAADVSSDGWAYWPKPARAAAKLMELIDGDGTWYYRFDPKREDATPDKLKAAYVPLKGFRTRSGLSFTIFETDGRAS